MHFDRFSKYAPHLMPFARNAYYTKQLELVEVDGLSAVYSSVDAGSLRNSTNLQNALRKSIAKLAKKNETNEEAKTINLTEAQSSAAKLNPTITLENENAVTIEE